MRRKKKAPVQAVEQLGGSADLPATPDQLFDPVVEQRKKATQKFNRLYVYIPLAITAVIAMLVFGLAAGTMLFGGESIPQGTGSGLADIVVILFMLVPLTLLLAALIGGAGYALYWRRNKGSVIRAPLQKAAVKVDGFATTANDKAEAAQASVADRIIKTNSKVNQASALVRKIGKAAKETVNDIQSKI